MSKRRLTLEDLYAFKSVSDPQISPDGETVAFVTTTMDAEKDDYRSQIWVVPGEGAGPQPLTQGNNDRAPRWSPDGGRLAFVRKVDEGQPQVWVIPLGGGEARRLTDAPQGVSEFAWAPDGLLLAYTAFTDLDGEPADEQEAEKRKHYPVVVKTLPFKAEGSGLIRGRRRHLFVISDEGVESRRLSDGDFDVAMPAWSPDGSKIAFATTLPEERERDYASQILLVDASGGKPSRVGFASGSAAAPAWTGDAQILFVGKPQPHSDEHLGLYMVAYADGVPAEVAADLDRNIAVGGLGSPGTAPAISADGASVIFCARDQGAAPLYICPTAGGSVKKAPGVADGAVLGMTAASRAPRLAYVLATQNSPGDVFVGELDGRNHRQLTFFNQDLMEEADVFLPKERWFQSPDGASIQGWVLVGDEKGPAPLLLEIHGGPHNAFGPYFQTRYLYHQSLAARGWNILYINSRGSDGYGEEFFRALRGQWGEADFPDFMAAVDAVVEEGLADPKRLAVTGNSYGGYMTTWIVGHTDRFAAAVAAGVLTDLESMFGTSDVGAFLGWELEADAHNDRELYAALSPITYVERVTTPVLLFHGLADDRCPLGQAEQWFVALKRQEKVAEMVLYPDAQHVFMARAGLRTGSTSHGGSSIG